MGWATTACVGKLERSFETRRTPDSDPGSIYPAERASPSPFDARLALDLLAPRASRAVHRHRETDMSLKTLADLYVHELKDLYSAEKQLIEALPKMVEASNAPQLREAFASHLKETEQHFEKVHQLLQNLDENPGSTKCKGMEGLLEEGEDAIDEEASPAVRDAFLIAAAQRVEHYEISGYGTARAYARSLGREEDAEVLNQILDQEYAADNKLDKLAEGSINESAKRV
jgi:ferritin-like metal-binding protein YciE